MGDFKSWLIGFFGALVISVVGRTMVAIRRRFLSRRDSQFRSSRHFYVLARPNLSCDVLLPKSRHRCHDQPESRRRGNRPVYQRLGYKAPRGSSFARRLSGFVESGAWSGWGRIAVLLLMVRAGRNTSPNRVPFFSRSKPEPRSFASTFP